MQRSSLALGSLRSVSVAIAVIMAAVLVAVALTFVGSSGTIAESSLTVILDPDDETDAIDLTDSLTYNDAKSQLEAIDSGSTIKLLFPADPGLGQLGMSGTKISFVGTDNTDGVITFEGSSTLMTAKFNTSFTATWGGNPTPELVLSAETTSDISTSDLIALLPVDAPSGLPELTLNDANLSVGTSPAAISVFANATFLGVTTSVLFSTADRDNDSETALEFVFGLKTSSFAFSAFGVPLPEPLQSTGIPISMTVANADLTLASTNMTPPELAFFSGFYGPSPFVLDLDSGLTLAGEVPFSALPNPIIKELGLTPTTDTVLLEGNVNVETDPSVELVALSLTATMPSGVSLPGLPTWIVLAGDGLSLELNYDSSEGASEISLAVAGDFNADLNGTDLGFHLGLTLQIGDTTSVEITGNTTTPWVAPFGIPWLTLDEVSLTITVEGTDIGVELASEFTIETEPDPKSFQIKLEVSGSPGSLAATVTATSLDPLTSNDILAVLGNIVEIEPPVGLPELALNDLTISIETGEATAFSISADVTFLGVGGSVLFSVTDRDNNLATPPEFLLGVNIPSFQLKTLADSVGISLPEPLASEVIPEVAFVVSGTPGSISLADLTPPELEFFSGAFGSLPAIDLAPGLNLAGEIPLAALPEPMLVALGVDSDTTAAIQLEGAIELELSIGPSPSILLVSLSLKAVLPAGLGLPGLPTWIVLAGDGLSLELNYDSSEGASEISLAVAGDFNADLNGTDLGFHLGLTLQIGDTTSVEITGNTTTPWVAPFGIPWLTLDEVSLTITVEGTDIGVSLASEFTIGTTPFAVSLDITGSAGALDVTISASAGSLSSDDLVALLAKAGDAAGIPTAGLTIPNVTLTGVEVSIEAGTSGVGFSAGGHINVEIVPGVVLDAQLLASFDLNASGDVQLILGIQASNVSLCTLVVPLQGTLVCDFELDSLALILSVGDGRFESSVLSAPVKSFYEQVYGTAGCDETADPGCHDFTLDLKTGLNLIAAITLPPGALKDGLNALAVADQPLLISGTLSIPGLGGSAGVAGGLPEIHLAADLPQISLPPITPAPIIAVESGQLSFHIDINPAGSPAISIGVKGTLTLIVNEGGDNTVLIASVRGDFGGPPITLSLAGQLKTENDEDWVAPFGLEWLTFRQLGISFTLSAPPVSFSIQLSADADIAGKNLDVTIGLTVTIFTVPFTPPIPVPVVTNFEFEGTSTSNWGTTDLQALAAAGEIELPNIEVRPISDTEPITVKFVLRDSPPGAPSQLTQGIDLKGTIWADLDLPFNAGPLTKVASLDLHIGTDGIDIEGSIPGLTILGTTLSDLELDLEVTFIPPSFSFIFTGTLTTAWGSTHEIDIDLSSDALVGLLLDALNDMKVLVEEVRLFAIAFGMDALEAIEAFFDDPHSSLASLLGDDAPEWIQQLFVILDLFDDGVDAFVGDRIDLVINGYDYPGFPPGGAEPAHCHSCFGYDPHPCLLTVKIDDRCYVIPFFPFHINGLCNYDFDIPCNDEEALLTDVQDGAEDEVDDLLATYLTVPLPPNNEPSADAGGPYEVDEGSNVSLSAASSTDPDDPDGDDPLTYSWKFFLGSTITTHTTGVDPKFSFSAAGLSGPRTIFFSLTVTDEGGLSSTAVGRINVANVPPSVNLPGGSKVPEGTNYLASGSFTDPGADVWTAGVDYGDDTGLVGLTLNPDKTFDLSHVYADNGSYTVTVTVDDDDGGEGTDSLVVTVNNVAPTVDAGEDQKSDEGDKVSLDPATFNDKGTLDTHTATIDWGDGTSVDVGVVSETPSGPPGSMPTAAKWPAMYPAAKSMPCDPIPRPPSSSWASREM